MSRYINGFWSSVIIALGIAALGWFIYAGVSRIPNPVRTVSVKGLSEKEVPADKVIWPLVYRQASNDLGSLYFAVEQANKAITHFLISNGIPENEITISPVSIIDSEAERYSSNDVRYRYKTTSVVTVATDKVDLVRNLMAKQGDLVKQGIALTGGDYEYPTIFSFNKLNEIKPQMVEEATQNGRITAQKFAEDSKSKLGKIRNASQGQFSISDRDSNTPYIKVVRVVTTIEYFLKD